jgi:hypothetical protein
MFCKMIVLDPRGVSFHHALVVCRFLLADLVFGSSCCHCCLRVGGRAATVRWEITASHNTCPNSSPCSWHLLVRASPKRIWTSANNSYLQLWLAIANSAYIWSQSKDQKLGVNFTFINLNWITKIKPLWTSNWIFKEFISGSWLCTKN